jgi:hypothetical protein
MGSAVNLLNAGWTATTAAPLPDGGWTVPQQALTVFVEAPWDQLNRLVTLVLELVDDEGHPVHFAPGPEANGPPVRIEHQVVVPPVPGAPNGTPGLTTVFLDLPPGALWLTPRHRYIWRVSTEGIVEEIGFWVQAPPQLPVIGGGPGLPPIPPAPAS